MTATPPGPALPRDKNAAPPPRPHLTKLTVHLFLALLLGGTCTGSAVWAILADRASSELGVSGGHNLGSALLWIGVATAILLAATYLFIRRLRRGGPNR